MYLVMAKFGPCCRYDKLLGMYITRGGTVRRMDIILAPPEELQMCLIAWTGSKQYLRFLRQHAINRGMSLSAHRYLCSCCWSANCTKGVRCQLNDSGQTAKRLDRRYIPQR